MYWFKERVVTICRNWRREQDSWPRNLSKTRPNPTKAFCLSGKSTTRIAYHSICHTDSSSFYNLKVMIWSYSFNNKQGGGVFFNKKTIIQELCHFSLEGICKFGAIVYPIFSPILISQKIWLHSILLIGDSWSPWSWSQWSDFIYINC